MMQVGLGDGRAMAKTSVLGCWQRIMLPIMKADFDFDDERHSGPWERVLGVLRIVAEAALVAGAIAILYLAFRGPSSHPSASAAPASPHSPFTAGAPGSGQGAAARPPTVPSATPTVTAPSASPRAGAPSAADSFSAQAQAYLAGRRGSVEAAVYDLSTGQQWTVGRQAPQAAASVVDVQILEAMLNQQTIRRTVLSLTEQDLSPPMIEQSDEDAAGALWTDVGGAQGMRAFDQRAGLAHTSPSSCAPCSGFSGPGSALASTTPQDQVTLLRQLVQPSRVLDKNDQKYALFLLENVTSSQRWGVSAGVPAGVTVALKNGALPLNPGDSDWQVNSVGWVSGGGRSYLLSVLSTGDPSEEYGIDTLNHLGAMVWSALAPRR
jgi:beta-lactamase class A